MNRHDGFTWLLISLGVVLTFAPCPRAAQSEALRPPAVPLVAHDPYFSIWSPADRLTDTTTTHWTGKPHPLRGMLSVDGQPFHVIGCQPAGAPALPQTGLSVWPTRTIYRFANAQVKLTLTFMTPALPEDLDILARPLTYITWEVRSADDKAHAVQLDFSIGGELAVNTPDQPVQWDRPKIEGLTVLRAAARDQRVLARKGDDLRIEWGYACLAAPAQQDPEVTGNGALRFDLGRVGAAPVTRHVLLAYDDLFSIKYFGTRLRPYWRRNGAEATDLLRAAERDYAGLKERCRAFDEQLMADLRKAGGEKYAALCALAYRQTFAGNKLVADANGMPLMFPKENFSNGCIGTVDVLFPQAPFFLAFSPALTRAMLVPILDYASSPLWPYGYAPHDLGTYPWAMGQVYGMRGDDGARMPVEESGNMLIMLAALARIEGNASLAQKYWPLLTKWADYLVANGLDPANQKCSADMFGYLPHCANLALKAIIGIGGYARLCELAGKRDDAAKYMAIARDYAAKWQKMARDDGRTRLAYHLPGTWGMKHNLIWDRVLGLNLFPESVGNAEIAWYLKVQNRYGLPVDNRTETSLIDWAMWSIAPARDPKDFEALVTPLFNYANETPTRVPLSDWFVTTDAKKRGFQARPVVGGMFIRLLTSAPVWAQKAAKVTGKWAPFPDMKPITLREIVPTAQRQPVLWRYTLEKPGEDWFKPDFKDAAWKEAPAGFGTRGTPGAIVRTGWKTKEIWLRRAFMLGDEKLKTPHLLAHYDEDATVYINGVWAAELPRWTSDYESIEISPEARTALRPGRNVFAVHCRQTTGGQYIDVGLADGSEVATTSPIAALPADFKPLFDYPVRDTCVCLGPDGMYYLTGTTGYPTWWQTNEGIRIWKSADLKNWEPLGLVWSFARDATWQKPRVTTRGKQKKETIQAVWAPELHYIKGNFYIAYCMNVQGGTGLLRSKTGKPEGPYDDIKKDGPLTGRIDASLFCDDDGKVYFVWQNGMIARLKDDLSGLAEEPRHLAPANATQVGFEGAFLTKIDGRYHLICAEFNGRGGQRTYDCMAASADSIDGPYGDRYLAIPHGGHNMLFKDKTGQWWSTFFGNDATAPFRERPAILPLTVGQDGRIRMK